MAVSSSDPTRAELDKQFAYYDSRAKLYGYTNQAINYVNAIAASSAAILGIFTSTPAIVPGVLAAVVAILAIVNQVSHPERQWIRTRRAAELLRRERTFYDAKAGEYANVGSPSALLAVRLDAIRTAELEDFFSSSANEDAAKPGSKASKDR